MDRGGSKEQRGKPVSAGTPALTLGLQVQGDAISSDAAQRPASGTVGRQESRGGFPGSETVLNFRVEQHDEEGDVVAQVSVQMAGKEITGDLTDGDEVALVRGRLKKGTWRARRIDNLTTGSQIRRTGASKLALAVKLVILVIALALIAVVVMRILPDRDEPRVTPIDGRRLSPTETPSPGGR